MLFDPKHLIDRSILDLDRLSDVLAHKVRAESTLPSAEMRICEELVATIDSLIPRLKAARNVRIAAIRSRA